MQTLPPNLVLKSGSHHTREQGMCAMEAVAFVAGEPHSDSPACASTVIATFMRQWNDSLPSDAERTRLLAPLIPRLVGTASTPGVERKRSYLALDWMIRVFTPIWLELVPALAAHTKSLRELAPIVDMATATSAGPVVRAAWDAARAAAWDAAGDAAWDAAWDVARAAARAAAWDAAGAAAWDAAWDAAGDAARAAAGDAARAAAWDAARAAAWDAAGDAARAAAGDAARAAAWDAAGDAAWDAAWDAAGDAARAAAGDAARAAAWDAAGDAARERLAPTVTTLQASALDLVERMLAVVK